MFGLLCLPFDTTSVSTCRSILAIEDLNEFSPAAHHIFHRHATCGHCRHSSQSKSSVISIGMATRAGQKSPDVGVGICLPRFSSTAKSNGMETIYRFGPSITALEYCAGFRAQQFTKFRFLAMLSRVKSHVIGFREDRVDLPKAKGSPK